MTLYKELMDDPESDIHKASTEELSLINGYLNVLEHEEMTIDRWVIAMRQRLLDRIEHGMSEADVDAWNEAICMAFADALGTTIWGAFAHHQFQMSHAN